MPLAFGDRTSSSISCPRSADLLDVKRLLLLDEVVVVELYTLLFPLAGGAAVEVPAQTPWLLPSRRPSPRPVCLRQALWRAPAHPRGSARSTKSSRAVATDGTSQRQMTLGAHRARTCRCSAPRLYINSDHVDQAIPSSGSASVRRAAVRRRRAIGSSPSAASFGAILWRSDPRPREPRDGAGSRARSSDRGLTRARVRGSSRVSYAA